MGEECYIKMYILKSVNWNRSNDKIQALFKIDTKFFGFISNLRAYDVR